jgi:YD repeat-containing protein
VPGNPRIWAAALVVLALVGGTLVWLRSSGGEQLAVEPTVQCGLEGCAAGVVGTATGRLWIEHEDLGADPVSGAVGLQRTYTSHDDGGASFGPGWRSLLDTRLEPGESGPTLVGFPFLPSAPVAVEDGTVTFADGTRWGFDSDGDLSSVTTSVGREFRLDRFGSVVSIREGSHPLIEVTLADGRVDAVADRRPNGAGSIAYSYEDGRLVEVNSTLDGERVTTYRYGYAADGLLTRSIDSSGETRVEWTDDERVGAFTASGQRTTLEYPDAVGEPTMVVLPGATEPTEFLHNRAGRLLEVRQGDSVRLRRGYDPEGRLVLDVDPGDVRRFTWEGGRLAMVDSEASGVTELSWDDRGRLAATRAGGVETSYRYEGDMWAPSEVARGSAAHSYSYEDAIWVGVTDPDGVAADLGDRAEVTRVGAPGPLSDDSPDCDANNDGLVLDTACRPVGLLLGDSDDDAVESTIEYDEFGRVAAAGGPNGIERFTYDDRGRVATTQRGDVTFTNVYDGSRLHKVTADDGSVLAEYEYDAQGRVLSLTSSQGTVRRAYGNDGRLERVEHGGLVWEITEFSAAGRPLAIETPYGPVRIDYDESGRVASTQVGEVGGPVDGESITTTYERSSTESGEVATITRGGHVTTLTYEEQRLTSARTPLGQWEYVYDEDDPGRLGAVSGPSGTTTYAYDTDSQGDVRLTEIRRGDETRSLEWDEFGRLTSDTGGATDRSFEYRRDGIVESGSDGRRVTWGESGLPERVESHSATEFWEWNPDRTLRSITIEGRGLPFPSGEQVWAAQYDEEQRLVGFDKADSDDDLLIDWATDPDAAVPIAIARGDRDALRLGWTELGDIETVALGEETWQVDRDEFANVSAVGRNDRPDRTLNTSWLDGLPVGVEVGDDSLTVEDCTSADCTVELTIGERNARLVHSENSIEATVGDTRTTFDRDDDGLITSGCQSADGDEKCTDWLPSGEVGERRELARFEELLGGTNGQLRGLASRPLPLDPPALASLPAELTPHGLHIRLPDEQLGTEIAAAAPVLPTTYRLGDDGAEARLAERLAPISVDVALGPGHRLSLDPIGDGGFAEPDLPFDASTPLEAALAGLSGIEPDSLLRGVGDFAWSYRAYALDALTNAGTWMLSAALLAAVGTGLTVLAYPSVKVAIALVAIGVAGACLSGTQPCMQSAKSAVLSTVTGTLGKAAVTAARAVPLLVGLSDGAVALASGSSRSTASRVLAVSTLAAKAGSPVPAKMKSKDLVRIGGAVLKPEGRAFLGQIVGSGPGGDGDAGLALGRAGVTPARDGASPMTPDGAAGSSWTTDLLHPVSGLAGSRGEPMAAVGPAGTYAALLSASVR